MSSDKPILGLTGGIASGKSTVADTLRVAGVAVVDADRIYAQVVAPGSEGLAAVVAEFGKGVLTEDGSLDRPALSAIVFSDDSARKRLNAITHPRVGQLSMERLAEMSRGEAPYLVYEAPLLVESGAHKGMAAVIVVAASKEVQVARVMARDGSTEAEARSRIAAQLPLAEKIQAADYVIQNNRSREQLVDRTRQVHQSVLERFGLTQ